MLDSSYNARVHIMAPPGPLKVAEGTDSAESVNLSRDGSGALSPGRCHRDRISITAIAR